MIRKIVITISLSLYLFTLPAYCDKDQDKINKLLIELNKLKIKNATLNDKMKRITDTRWYKRQHQIEKKENMKKDIDMLVSDIERQFSEIARIREEIIIKEDILGKNKNDFNEIKQANQWFNNTIDNIIEKELKLARIGFPLFSNERIKKINNISFISSKKTNNFIRRVKMLGDYAVQEFDKSKLIKITPHTILLDNNEAKEVNVISFGNVFGYGLNKTGRCYYLGHTGKTVNPFKWIEITDNKVVNKIFSSMPKWLKSSKINENIYVDVIQNKYSEKIIGAKSKNLLTTVHDFIKAGGVVLIPLLMICIWAIILIINRIITYSIAHKRGDLLIEKIMKFIDNKEYEKAQMLASNSKGVLAKVITTCIEHLNWTRSSAEKKIKERLLSETPVLDKHLDTLAVLAGASPLLGLLGTVTGMIKMFESITRFGTGDPKLLAGGISEALITTEVGLAIAIPILLIHNFLRNRNNHIQSDLDMYSMRLLNKLWSKQ